MTTAFRNCERGSKTTRPARASWRPFTPMPRFPSLSTSRLTLTSWLTSTSTSMSTSHGHDHAHRHGHDHGHDHNHEPRHDHNHSHEHDHESAFRRWSYQSDVPFTTLDDVRRGLNELPDSILRVKGFVATEATREQRMLLQMAGRRVAFSNHGAWPNAPHTALAILGLPDGPSDAEVQSVLNARLAGPAAFTQ